MVLKAWWRSGRVALRLGTVRDQGRPCWKHSLSYSRSIRIKEIMEKMVICHHVAASESPKRGQKRPLVKQLSKCCRVLLSLEMTVAWDNHQREQPLLSGAVLSLWNMLLLVAELEKGIVPLDPWRSWVPEIWHWDLNCWIWVWLRSKCNHVR